MKTTTFLCFFLFFIACSKHKSYSKIRHYSTPEILAIYPSRDSLPENLLRFYIEFSTPMKAVNNLENIRLVDADGHEVKGAIFNNVYELWDDQQQHLTLILDPSRVKTGLIAHNTRGRALKAGQHFQLIIDKAEDIYGNSLVAPVIKDIYVQPSDLTVPSTENWVISTPNALTKEALTINFPDMLDRLSLFYRLRLLAPDKTIVDGNIDIQHQETQWVFTPKQAWQQGTYTLQVNSRLEDPAGNNLNGLFDHAIGGLKDDYEGKIINIDIVVP